MQDNFGPRMGRQDDSASPGAGDKFSVAAEPRMPTADARSIAVVEIYWDHEDEHC